MALNSSKLKKSLDGSSDSKGMFKPNSVNLLQTGFKFVQNLPYVCPKMNGSLRRSNNLYIFPNYNRSEAE